MRFLDQSKAWQGGDDFAAGVAMTDWRNPRSIEIEIARLEREMAQIDKHFINATKMGTGIKAHSVIVLVFRLQSMKGPAV